MPRSFGVVAGGERAHSSTQERECRLRVEGEGAEPRPRANRNATSASASRRDEPSAAELDGDSGHDTFSGVLDAASLEKKYGQARYQEQRNSMYRSSQEGLLIELTKWGLGRRDVGANVNFFSKVSADLGGRLQFERAHRQAGQHVDLRFEMNVLVVLAAAPHPLDPAPTYAPGAVALTAWRSGTAGVSDVCRLSCPENERGFINTERWFL